MEEVMHRKVEETSALEEEMVTREITLLLETFPLKNRGIFLKDREGISLKNNKDRDETSPLKNIGIFHSDREITSPLKIKGTSHRDREETFLLKNREMFLKVREEITALDQGDIGKDLLLVFVESTDNHLLQLPVENLDGGQVQVTMLTIDKVWDRTMLGTLGKVQVLVRNRTPLDQDNGRSFK